MPAPRPGSRMVAKPPNLLRTLMEIRQEITKLRSATRPETVAPIPAAPSLWIAATSATMANALRMHFYRSGSKILADVVCNTGAGSVLSVQLTVPALGVTGPAATTASGGTERIVRVTLTMPTAWASGAVYPVYLQAMRVSGADATTVQILRAWQR